MKAQIITLVAVTMLSTNAVAEESVDEICGLYAKVAAGVMEIRQKDLPMAEVMETFDGTGKEFKSLGRAMVMDAYDAPAWATDSNKLRAISEFSNEVARDCYEAFANAEE